MSSRSGGGGGGLLLLAPKHILASACKDNESSLYGIIIHIDDELHPEQYFATLRQKAMNNNGSMRFFIFSLSGSLLLIDASNVLHKDLRMTYILMGTLFVFSPKIFLEIGQSIDRLIWTQIILCLKYFLGGK